jgi:site-specific recombinase XerD
MNLIESVMHYRRYLKRKNYSNHTIKNYLNRLKHFLVWLPVPVELAKPVHVKHYIDTLLEKRLGPQTINGHLVAIRGFTDINDQGLLGVFDDAQATKIINIVDRVNDNAKVVVG